MNFVEMPFLAEARALAAKSRPFIPKFSFELAASATYSFDMQGVGSDSYGIYRMLFSAYEATYSGSTKTGNGGDKSGEVLVTALMNPGADETVLFRDIHMNAVQQIFSESVLDTPVVIEGNNKIRFTLTNLGSAKVDVHCALQGWDSFVLTELRKKYIIAGKGTGKKMPSPYFLYNKTSLTAGQTGSRNELGRRSIPLAFQKFAVGASDLKQIQLRMERNTDVVLDTLGAPVINQLTYLRDEPSRFQVYAADPLTLIYNNVSNSVQTVSFLAIAYEVV